MRTQIYGTRAIQPDQRAKVLRDRGVMKIREAGLPAGHPLVETAIAFIKGMPSPATTQNYGYNIGYWFAWCVAQGIDPAEATRLHGKAYLAELHGRAPTSRAQHMSSLRSFYEDLVDEDLVARNPFRRIVPRAGEPITPTPALSFDEFRRLLAKIRADFDHPDRDICARRDFAMIYLMGRLGLRRMEVHELSWASLQGRGDHSALSVHGKGDKYAIVHVPLDVLEVLGVWRSAMATALGEEPGPGTPMFPALGGAQRFHGIAVVPLAINSIGLEVRRRMIDAGFEGPRYSSHALRATAATIAHDNGAELLTIMRLLRHANARTTQGYIKAAENKRHSAAESWEGPSFAIVG